MRVYQLLFLYFFFGQCNAQRLDNNTGSKNHNMEKFNIKEFEKNQTNGEYNFIREDGKLIRQFKSSGRKEYTEEIRNEDTNFSEVRVYYMNTGNLKVRGDKFYNFPIGIWQHFAENNKLTKEENWDLPYKISIDDLAEKMLEEELDIMKPQKGFDVLRAAVIQPVYVVVYPVGPHKPYDFHRITVDGITGEIIDRKINSSKR